METYHLHKKENVLTAFQKDLIVWKQQYEPPQDFEPLKVSEGLNSVETWWCEMWATIEYKQFQKDLIV